MKKKCDVSVIIPFYKNKDYLLEAIKSVENQSLLPEEIIIVNDGVIENIDDINSDYFDVVIINQTNNGAAHARNTGIKSAKCKYVAFLDSDDIWYNTKLEVQYNLMEENNSVWSYHLYNKFKDKFYLTNDFTETKYKIKNMFFSIVNSCQIGTPSVIIKRDVILKEKLFFNEKLKFGEDTCLWLLLSYKYDSLVISNELCGVRIHGNNAKYNPYVQINARKNIWDFMVKNKLNDKLNLFTKIAFKICCFESYIISNKYFNRLTEKIKKLVCGIMFVFPWLIFKFVYKITK